jgi:cytochrome c biogenesis protein CcdA
MNDFLQSILDNSNIPIVTAFVLGLLTAISPCPLATNITAVGYISRNIESKKRIFWNGILYTIGRIVAYSLLGAILIYILNRGEDMFYIQKKVSVYGEILIAPAMIFIGIFLIFSDHLNLPKFGFSGNIKSDKLNGAWGSLLLGMLFAMAFCPTSGVLYFGMLIPMSAQTTAGYFLPIIFAIATGLPVIFVAWFLAYSVAGVGKFYNRMRIIQKWFNIIIAVLFIFVGLYYAYTLYL